ncbi:MAG: GNAT family acetyltransferase [Gammaproteobacteria bacterium]|nr:GNAT family acetyltransferase [Gammaproteobacteria bacterium]
MDIRVFRESDRSALIALWQETGLTRPWNNPDLDIDRKLARDPDGLFVGEINGEIVASYMLGYDGHRGWINYLAVSTGQQRMGLGRQLMAHAEQTLFAMGCPKLNLQVRADNAAAKGFYKALGYTIDSVESLGKRLIED